MSGANLAIVAGFVVHTARTLGVRGRLLPWLGLVAIAGFVVLARPQPSVLRAAVMGTIGLSALASGRRRRSLAALAAATLALLLIDPWLSRSYGFALSVLATGGLLLLAPSLTRWLGERGVPQPLAQAVAVPAAAQVACAPLLVLLSGQVSLVAVPANLLAAPAVAPATVLGLLATLAGPLSDPLAAILGWTAGRPAWWIVTVAEQAAGLPAAAVGWPSSLTGALTLVLLLAIAVPLARRAARRPALVAAAAVTLVGSAVVVASRPGWPPPGWVLVACDVGQGDALVLSAGRAGAVVVDAGPDPPAVDGCLRGLGVDRVAMVLLTHLHADHVAGLPGVLHDRQVGEVMIGPYDEPVAGLHWVRRWTSAAGVPLTRSVQGARFRLGTLSWRILAPSDEPAAYDDDDGSAPNNASVVLLARRHGVRMLLTGDIEPPAQRDLLRSWHGAAVDVLKVAHHGSAYQSPELLAAVQPRVALVSVGSDNDYGHPSPRTLRDLTAAGVVVGRTDHDGSLAVVGPADRLRLVRARR